MKLSGILAVALSIIPLLPSPLARGDDKLNDLVKQLQVQQGVQASLLAKLTAYNSVPDPMDLKDAPEDFKHDCFTQCQPTSAGGNCPDDLFLKYMVMPDDVATSGKINPKKFQKEVMPQYDDKVETKTLCHAVESKLRSAGSLIRSSAANCIEAYQSCRFKARKLKAEDLDREISSLDDVIQKLQIDISNQMHAAPTKDSSLGETSQQMGPKGTNPQDESPASPAKSVAQPLGSTPVIAAPVPR